ncbi:MAG: hypothetical protein M1814_002157 [Vezdaea aestivalis]|nr:MAG: hypothetical protein M1814_002157 [Vezdaea aestivalis]
MAAIQLSFNLRTSANVKTVHLLGSWDNYQGQLPLSKATEKAGAWKGTFRFQGQTLKQGSRYWYYYIIDGYHVSHDPAQSSTKESTTGRMLNILDVPSAAPTAAAPPSRRRNTVAKGRPLSVSKIQSPHPTKPYATRKIIDAEENSLTLEKLASKFQEANLDDEDDTSDDDDSLISASTASSASSSRSGSVLSAGSISSNSSVCSCERYGITRKGDRIRLDCGGSRCGSGDSDSCCSSDEEEYVSSPRAVRRQGVVIRR